MSNTMSLSDIMKEDGVSDLPTMVKGKFAQALRAERQGDDDLAYAKLLEAILAEEKINSQ